MIKPLLYFETKISGAYCRFAFPCFASVYPGLEKIKFLLMYVHEFVFYIIYLLTCFHINIFVRAFHVNTNHFVWFILTRLDDFAISAIANIFVPERLKIPEAYSEPSETSKFELFANLVFS